MKALTEEQIVDRAEELASLRRTNRILFLMALATVLVTITQPIHAWLRAHVEFFWGVLAGSSVQAVLWIRDRWRWMKWFSYQ